MNHFLNKKLLYPLCALITVILVLIDRISKIWAVNTLKGSDDIVIIKGVFQLHYLENIGAAFSILSGKLIVFYILTPVICIGILWIFFKVPVEKRFIPLFCILLFLFAGAVGNYIDRIYMGSVVDFFYFSLINFPVFNVADIYVTCAMAVLLILFVFYYKEEDFDRVLK